MLYRQIQRKFIFFSQLLARVQFRDEQNTTLLAFYFYNQSARNSIENEEPDDEAELQGRLSIFRRL